MSQDIKLARSDSGEVSAFLYGFCRRFAVDYYEPSSHCSGFLSKLRDGPRGNMSKLHTGDGKDVPVGSGQSAIVADFLDYSIKGTEGYMVSNGNSGITIDKSTTY